MDISDFYGTYTVRTADQNFGLNNFQGPVAQINDPVVIAPHIPPDTATVTIGQRSGMIFSWSENSKSLQYELKDIPYTDPDGNPRTTDGRMVISLAVGLDGFQAVYAAFLAGDPQQVGVWGADNGGP